MHRPARGFVLRAPVLPFATLEGLDAARLRALVEEPAIAEAIFLASPALATAKGDGVERALLRYVSRMAGRATPFGLFSGVAVGTFGDATRFAIGARHRRTTRLDTDYLARLCERLAHDLRAELAYVPNTSLYRVGDRLRYVEARLESAGRTHHLVAIDASTYVEAVLARAARGATMAELADVLAGDPELTRVEIDEFLESLVVEQVLCPVLQPPVTGPDPTAAIANVLRALPSGRAAAAVLDETAARLAAIDRAGVSAPSAYREVTEALQALPVPADTANLVRVDLEVDADVVLGPRIATEIARGVELLRRLLPPPEDSWAPFRDRFTARYERREVPLVELLDEESGIGFGSRSDDGAQAPLLDELPSPAGFEPQRAAVTPRSAHLVRLATRGDREVVLTDADLAIIATPAPPPTVDSFIAFVHVLAASPEAADTGDFQLWVREVTDGSATRQLGRFCHASAGVEALMREIARAEERLAPEALFAEIAHLPEGRVGNILIRPVLRGHEIAFLGTSGIAPELQIPVTDLMVSIEGARVVLRSASLGREIRPAFATAHNYWSRNGLAIYRFLAALSSQGAHGGRWTWGPLEAAPFLPRIRHGRSILSRARWLLERDELADLTSEKLAALRARRDLPRWIGLSDGDNELPVDLENPLALDLLADRPGALVYEWLRTLGTHVHELFVPFVADRPPEVLAPRPTHIAIARRFPPGSRWLYAKLYGGTTDTENVLRAIAPFLREVQAIGLAEQFFFIRYADPEPHVRLRFTGDPARLAGELLPQLAAQLAEHDQIWRLQLDTYEREIERYGDIETAERVFAADSTAVLEIIETTPGAAGRDARWRLALCGIDQFFATFGLDLVARRSLVTSLRDSFGAEQRMDVAFQKRLGLKYRAHADEIATLLAATPGSRSDPEHPLAPGLAALVRRTETLAGIACTPEIAASHIHMHVNRMLPVAARRQELVLYDLLRRHYARATYR